MKEITTLCGDNCAECPRYNAHSDEELSKTAQLWHKLGLRDHIVSNDEIRCTGCSSHKDCTYHIAECVKSHGVSKCNRCTLFPCNKIADMLKRTDEYQIKYKELCSAEEYAMLERAFFHKIENQQKL